MANNNDYGYFGKGTEGYAHYKQAFNRNFGQGKKPSGGGGGFDFRPSLTIMAAAV